MNHTPLRWVLSAALAVSIAPAALLGGSAATTYAAGATRLNHPVAAAGDTEYLLGTGYPVGDVVSVRASFYQNGAARAVASAARVGSNGAFIAAFVIPAGATPGSYGVSATDAHLGTSITHLAVLPTLRLSVSGVTTPVAAGRYFYLKASRFAVGSTVNLSISFPLTNGNSENVSRSISVQAGSRDEIAVQVPSTAGQGLVQVTATVAGKTFTRYLRIVPLAVFRAGSSAPAVSITPGSVFFVAGTGFAAHESTAVSAVYPLYGGGEQTVTRTWVTDTSGAFTPSLMRVPQNVKRVTVALAASGETSHRTATVDAAITYHPAIALSSTVVRPGGSVTINGHGFLARTVVRVTATGPSSTTVARDVTTDAGGAFSTTLQLPGNAPTGTYAITATGTTSGLSASTRLSAALQATLALQPANAGPGQSVKLVGAGFTANSRVAITAIFNLFGGGKRTISETVVTDGQGNFSLPLVIPSRASAGNTTIVASGPSTSARARLTVRQVNAHVSVSPAIAHPGGTVTINGAGFTANSQLTISTTVALYGGGSKTLTTTVGTNGSGQFSARLQLPARAAAGSPTITVRGPASTIHTLLHIGHLGASITVAPAASIPGGYVTVKGSGYLAGSRVDLTASIKNTSGSTAVVSLTATTNGSGQFTATLHVPSTAQAGSYTVTARGQSSGRAPTARLTVSRLAPSLVAVPTTAVPGTAIMVSGFGFSAGAGVTVTLNGQKLGSVTTTGSGAFTTRVTIPSSTATGSYTLSATGAQASAHIALAVNRQIASRYYFASIYTGAGYTQFLAILNPSAIQARVTISYLRTDGRTVTKIITIAPHSRYTEDAVADLGTHVSAGATVTADVPIVTERSSMHGVDGSVVPGVKAPASIWYFANGNTSGKYREYVAVENPNTFSVRVAFRLLPTHHAAMTVYRTMPATSRTTLKVNSFVRDAVGVTVLANGPVVANRTIFIHRGTTSKIGVNAPSRTWYFAGGPRGAGAKLWLGAINPNNSRTRITLHAYGPYGAEVGTKTGSIPAHGRVGYLLNRIAGRTDVSVVLTASRPIVAEQTSYRGNLHYGATDTFGVTTPTKSVGFAAVTTTNGLTDSLTLFNPNLETVPIVVQFMTSSGTVTQRTYVVGPLQHTRINVNSVVPNSQLGIVAASNYPFVALNRRSINGGQGSMTSTGIPL